MYRLLVAELDTPYHAHPEGSESKLNKFRDSARILAYFMIFLRDYAPSRVFGAAAALLAVAATAAFIPVGLEYLDTGLVPRLPTLVVSLTLYSLSGLALLGGVGLQAVANAHY